MKKFFVLMVMVLAVAISVNATLPTVTATLKVSNADGTFPSEMPDVTCSVTYMTTPNPTPIIYSPTPTYTNTTGAIVWTVPQNSYIKVGCKACYGFTTPSNYAIATSNVILNDMVASTPPSVTSVNSFVTMDCPSGTDPVADSALDTLTWTAGTGISITGNSTSDSITIANTAMEADTLDTVCERGNTTDKDITSTGTVTGNVLATTTGRITSAVAAGGTLFNLANTTPTFSSGTFLSLEPDRSIILDIDYLGTTNHRALGVPNIVLWNSSDAGTLDFLCDSNRYTHKLSGNPRATGNARFYLPVDEPAVESLLTMGPDGEMDFDTSVYLTAEVDGVVGNEVTDTNGTTLTRSGTGTSGDPYKLALNLGNANTWTTNQTAPYWLSSVQYDSNNPRPYGFPYGVTAKANDLEFNGTNPMTDTADIDSSTTEIPGWITIDAAGAAKQGLAYKALASAFATDSVIDCRAHISCNAWANGSTVVLAFLYNNAGSMDGWYVGIKGNNGYWQRVWGTVTNYVLSAPTATTIYDYKPYIGLYRLANGDLYFTDSEDGITWGSYVRLTTGADKAFTVFGVGADLSANSVPENNTVAVDWVRFK